MAEKNIENKIYPNKLIIYNTLTKSYYTISNFDVMTMYVCGPTLYDEMHIGNGRSLVIFDVFFRIFSHIFKEVVYVRNITDVDDKIVAKSIQRKISSKDLVVENEILFKRDIQNMNILSPTFEPKATEFLPQMFAYITTLLNKNFAYITDKNNIYFDVSKLSNYNFFQNVNALEEECRVISKEDKKDWKDFALWKSVNDHYGYDSPWGRGRPGWHLECSTMSNYYFGDHFMFHGGGQDLAFPHHHNEIAQGFGFSHQCCSEIFVHNGLICLNGQKMSKSLGNIVTIHQIAKDKYNGDILRYIYISTYYSSSINFTEEVLQNAQNTINKIREFKFKNINLLEVNNKDVYVEDLMNDMNIPSTLSHLFFLMQDVNNYNVVMNTFHLLGFDLSPRTNMNVEDIQYLLNQRQEAKIIKNFNLSDKIRQKLEDNFIKIQDNTIGQTWFYI